MKFTQESLLENLRAKLTRNNQELAMSERTLKSNVERLYRRLEKSGSEDELDAISEEYFPDFDEINKNIRKEKSDFANAWKDAHPDTNKNSTGDENNTKDGTLEKLRARLEELEKKDAEREANAFVARKKRELIGEFKKKGIKDDKWINIYVEKLNITKDSNIEEEALSALEFYNISHSDGGKGTPGIPSDDKDDNFDAGRWAGVNKYLGDE